MRSSAGAACADDERKHDSELGKAMRPNQNKRMRGRPTNGRRGPNPLTRSYESNGPDVRFGQRAARGRKVPPACARRAHRRNPVAAENTSSTPSIISASSPRRRPLRRLPGRAAPAFGEGESDDLEDDDDYSPDGSVRFACRARRLQFQPPQGGFQAPPGAANAPQPFVERPPFDLNGRFRTIAEGFSRARIDRAGRFPDRGPRRTVPSSTEAKGIATTGRTATTGRRASSGPTGTPASRNRCARTPRSRGGSARAARVHHGPVRTPIPESDGRRPRRSPRPFRLRRSWRPTIPSAPSERLLLTRSASAPRPSPPAAFALWLQCRAIGPGSAWAGGEPDKRRIAG